MERQNANTMPLAFLRDGSLKHPKHMLQLMEKKIGTFYAQILCLSRPMNLCSE